MAEQLDPKRRIVFTGAAGADLAMREHLSRSLERYRNLAGELKNG